MSVTITAAAERGAIITATAREDDDDTGAEHDLAIQARTLASENTADADHLERVRALLNDLADEIDALGARVETAERHHDTARRMTNKAQHDRNRAQAAALHLRPELAMTTAPLPDRLDADGRVSEDYLAAIVDGTVAGADSIHVALAAEVLATRARH